MTKKRKRNRNFKKLASEVRSRPGASEEIDAMKQEILGRQPVAFVCGESMNLIREKELKRLNPDVGVSYEIHRMSGVEFLCRRVSLGIEPMGPLKLAAPSLHAMIEFNKKVRLKQYGTPNAGVLPGHRLLPRAPG